jgi:hypothetical protein
MQKYIEEKFLQEDQIYEMDSTGWRKKPDLSRLITIEPSHFSDGFEQTITKIQFGELSYCYMLVSLDISSLCNLKEIESSTFKKSWSLREIKFPPSLEKISSGSFTDCFSLAKLDLSYLLNMTIIESDLFKNSWALKEISFPPNIQKIGTRTFTNCTRLVRLDLSNYEQLEEIRFDAFVNAWSLQEIIFPQNLRKITHHAFCNCTSLVRLRIPASVNEIETSAFSDCTNLEKVIFDNIAGISIAERAFENCPLLARRYPGFRYGKYSELKGTLQFDQGKSGASCGISLEEFCDESDIVVLPCGHAYMEESFHEWTKRQQICPTCKAAL